MSKRKLVTTTSTVSIAVDEAFSEIESLQQELEDWYNNLPENLQCGDKGDSLQTASDALGNCSTPDVPEILRNDAVSFTLAARKRASRSTRRDEAVERIRAVAESVRGIIGELESFADECETAIDEWEQVEFPGMYG